MKPYNIIHIASLPKYETTLLMEGPEYNIEYTHTPAKGTDKKKHIVIIGGGIIGVSTAYYLSKHSSFDPETHHITLFEASSIACGSSGKAGGLLANWAFPEQIVPLSFDLHQELSDLYDGENNWGYRRLNIISLEADMKGVEFTETEESEDEENELKELQRIKAKRKEADKKKPYPSKRKSYFFINDEDLNDNASSSSSNNNDKNSSDSNEKRELTDPLPKDLDWIKHSNILNWSILGDSSTTAQVHPYQFTHFILNEAMKTNAITIMQGKVTEIIKDTDNKNVTGIKYTLTKNGKVIDDKDIKTMDADEVVVTMGPWTSKLLSTCPVYGLRAHSITVQPSVENVSPYAIFTELQLDENKFFSPEIYPRADEIYVCGEGDTLVELPDMASDVNFDRKKCNELFHYVATLSPILLEGYIKKRQACYLPVLSVSNSSGPLIGETNMKHLYVASGHSCWGINNAPATGKILTELLMEGNCTSADISQLDPTLYFKVE